MRKPVNMKREAMRIEVSENGQVIGYLACSEFREQCIKEGAPSQAFLPELVEKFNAFKASAGESGRVKIVLNPGYEYRPEMDV